MTRRITTVAAIAATSLVLTACGRAQAPSEPPAASWPTGRSFTSTSVTEEGKDRPLVPGTVIRLTFTADKLQAQAGCNTMAGLAHVQSGALVVTELAITAMGCDPVRGAQDAWLSTFLTSKPAWSLTEPDLVLSTTDTRIAFTSGAPGTSTT